MKNVLMSLSLLSAVAVAAPSVPTLDNAQLYRENPALEKFLKSTPPRDLVGKRIALLVTDGVEEIELVGVAEPLRKRGAQVDVVSPRYQPLPAKFGVQYPAKRATHLLMVHFMENAKWAKIDRFIDEVKASEYDGVVLPGGAWNPDTLRTDAKALALLKDFAAQGKTIAAICHGPLVLVSADLLRGKKATAYWSVQLDVKNSGAVVTDEAVVVDGQFITSRFPFDLPEFIPAIAAALNK